MWEINCLLLIGFSIVVTAVLIAIRPVYPTPFLGAAGGPPSPGGIPGNRPAASHRRFSSTPRRNH
jgi:hypothetical protein